MIDSLVSIVSFLDYDKAYEAIQRTRNATAGRKY